MKPGLKKFHEDKSAAKSEAVVIADEAPIIKKVQVMGKDSGVYRVGKDYFAITKGVNAIIPDYVAEYLREKGKVV